MTVNVFFHEKSSYVIIKKYINLILISLASEGLTNRLSEYISYLVLMCIKTANDTDYIPLAGLFNRFLRLLIRSVTEAVQELLLLSSVFLSSLMGDTTFDRFINSLFTVKLLTLLTGE